MEAAVIGSILGLGYYFSSADEKSKSDNSKAHKRK